MSDGEIEDIRSAKDKLMNDAQSLFAKLYEQSGAQVQVLIWQEQAVWIRHRHMKVT